MSVLNADINTVDAQKREDIPQDSLTELERIKFPTGQYQPVAFSETQKIKWIQQIEALPALLELAVQLLDAPQLHTPYRMGGWSIHQIVHHVADSHLNGFIRLKMALTEDNPTIKAFDQDAWIDLEDTKSLPINISLTLLHALHLRWTKIYQSLAPEDWERIMVHPATGQQMSIWYQLGLYSWHGNHHLGQILALKERMGWT